MKKILWILLSLALCVALFAAVPAAAATASEGEILNEAGEEVPVFNVFGSQSMTENADGSISVSGTAAWRYGISSNRNIFLNPFSTKVKFDTANTDLQLSIIATRLRHGYYSDAGNEVLAVVLRQQSSSIAVDIFDNSGESILEETKTLMGNPTETWVTVTMEVAENQVKVNVNEIEFVFTSEQFNPESFAQPMFLKYGFNSGSQTAQGGFTVSEIDWGDAPEGFSEDVYGNIDGIEAALDESFGTQPAQYSYVLPIVFACLAGVAVIAGVVFVLLKRRDSDEKA